MKRVLNLGTWVADGKPFTVPLDFVTHTAALIAIRGGGKTVAATDIAEEMCEAGLPWFALDPTPGGVWWGLRCNPDGSPGGYPVVIIGGNHADLPFERSLATQVAEAFARENICVVADVSKESKTVWRGFVADFCDRLMELTPPTPRHLFIEEAPEFVPQKPVAEQKRSRAAVDRVIRLGRNAGYGATLLTQRFATVDKDVLTQCENILALRSLGKPDRRAVRDWIAEVVSPEPDDPIIDEFLNSLPSLADGEGWWWSPQWLKQFGRVKIRARKTFHPGRTRSVEDTPVQVKLSDPRDFVDRFRAVLETKPKAAPRMVEVGGIVEHGDRKAQRATTAENARVDAVRQIQVAQERAQAAEGEAGRLRGQVADLHRRLGTATATIGSLRQALEPQYRAMQALFAELDGAAAAGGIGGFDRATFEAWFPKLRSGARLMLQALLERGGELTIAQLGHYLRRKTSGGTWRADIGQLRSCQLVGPGDPVRLRVP